MTTARTKSERVYCDSHLPALAFELGAGYWWASPLASEETVDRSLALGGSRNTAAGDERKPEDRRRGSRANAVPKSSCEPRRHFRDSLRVVRGSQTGSSEWQRDGLGRGLRG